MLGCFFYSSIRDDCASSSFICIFSLIPGSVTVQLICLLRHNSLLSMFSLKFVRVSWDIFQLTDYWEHFCGVIISSCWQGWTLGAHWCLYRITIGSRWVEEIWFNLEVASVFQEWSRSAGPCNMWISCWNCCRLSCPGWWFAVRPWRDGVLVWWIVLIHCFLLMPPFVYLASRILAMQISLFSQVLNIRLVCRSYLP